jgi:2-aminoadipate transaminase
VDSAELLKQALQHDVAFVPGAAFFATEPDPASLRMSFTTNTVEEIGEGMARLAKVLL